MGALVLLLIMIVLVALYVTRSILQIKQGNVAIIERLGRYSRTLNPGLNLIIPFFERVAEDYSLREQTIDIPAQQCQTADGISTSVDAIMYWRIIDAYKAFYSVQSLRESLESLVQTILRDRIGEMALEETFSSRDDINRKVLKEVDQVTSTWGVKVTRVEIQEIKPPEQIAESFNAKKAAVNFAEAARLKAEGQREATETEARGDAEAIRVKAIADAEAMRVLAMELSQGQYSAEALQFLVAQNYLKTSGDISQSSNAKVLFMDPNSLPGAVQGILSMLENNRTLPPEISDGDPKPQNGKQ